MISSRLLQPIAQKNPKDSDFLQGKDEKKEYSENTKTHIIKIWEEVTDEHFE